ncbi:MAG TPA: citrate synthase [Gammaproteobacteria bacterium]|nr:citrate synthase [Gammaproteobacteria bacterium]
MKNPFADKATTAIWQETPTSDNPYNAQFCRLHGYELFDVAKNCRYVDTLFLLFKGELPDKHQSELLEQLMIFLINPGPRHPATRAAMNAGVSKSDHAHILPIGLIAMGGHHLGSAEVENAMHFLKNHIRSNPTEVAKKQLLAFIPEAEGDNRIAPGIGSRFASIDAYAARLAAHLGTFEATGKAFKWYEAFVGETSKKNLSWLNTGIAAAVFFDFGLGAREGAGLFQLMSAPGILAHGLEQTHKPITAMPLIEDENYVIEK